MPVVTLARLVNDVVRAPGQHIWLMMIDIQGLEGDLLASPSGFFLDSFGP